MQALRAWASREFWESREKHAKGVTRRIFTRRSQSYAPAGTMPSKPTEAKSCSCSEAAAPETAPAAVDPMSPPPPPRRRSKLRTCCTSAAEERWRWLGRCTAARWRRKGWDSCRYAIRGAGREGIQVLAVRDETCESAGCIVAVLAPLGWRYVSRFTPIPNPSARISGSVIAFFASWPTTRAPKKCRFAKLRALDPGLLRTPLHFHPPDGPPPHPFRAT